MGVEYHLGELKVALDPNHPKHIVPPAGKASDVILDIGCGAGQTLIAAYADRVTFGLDIDMDALKLGRSLTDQVRFACAKAEALPYRDRQFDRVISRVALPYSDIPRSLREIARVLRPGGAVWLTLHPIAIPWRSARSGNYKGKIHFAYICLNSLLLHLCQVEFPWRGRFESFQTEGGIRRVLRRAGFTDVAISRGTHFLVTATRNA